MPRVSTATLQNPKESPFTKVSFLPPKDTFQKEVTRRVNEFFKSRNISRNANFEMVFKTILILTGWALTYGLILSNLLPGWACFLLALGHGFCAALIGLNIAHDAIHGSYTKNQKLNRFIGLIFNVVGANDYVWSISHNLVHHTYTNIPHHDEDIHQIPILRMEPTQERWAIHRYQHIYAFLLYGLASLSWVFIKDYKKFFQHRLGGHVRKTFPKKEIIRLFAYKAVYYTLFLVIPFLVIDQPWYFILLGFLAAHFVEGFTLAIIFMLAHIIEGTEFPEQNDEGRVELAWADLQLHTTSNFAIKNPVVNYLFGGLNFQVEHHLFPKICHVHYPKISQIVKETALEYDLPYLEQETFFGAIASHQRVLKEFGRAA